MSGSALAQQIRYREMLKARSEDAKIRAEMGEKAPAFRNKENDEE